MGRGAATTRHQWILILAIAAGLVGILAGCGTGATPTGATPPASSSSSTSSAVAEGHNQADIAFAQGMIAHHAQAVTMSSMAATRAGSSQVKSLAARIQAAQQPEIDQMSGWLRAWNAPAPSADYREQIGHGPGGVMPGMMSQDQMNQLGQLSGAAFDRTFLQMMIEHHQGAVTMSRTELGNGRNPDARQLAQRIIDTQQREITDMQNLLAG